MLAKLVNRLQQPLRMKEKFNNSQQKSSVKKPSRYFLPKLMNKGKRKEKGQWNKYQIEPV
jgi:hypothetical protein